MIFRNTEVAGVRIVELEPHTDERGFFARSFCADEFGAAGIAMTVVQANISRNSRRGTLRGLHYQTEAAPEPKLVRCTAGRIFDVAVDLRPASSSFCRWTGHELDADSHNGLYIPAGCAHGFLTLSDDAEVTYLMGAGYAPELARGVRWNDPAFAIAWPFAPGTMSDKDATYPDFDTQTMKASKS
ncbi:MAG: dTDP-4-dehydrorhamnose 3,5-epimerase [Alphaproteobacteria bacterium]|nr:dTDP-4-dehydrorhamnose 3,5-epimerase [Alphaproteobacteria bacterium]MCZ6586695.1 dTDP-4-dehydrorhamnose 3,5-epimerase [Alphaproteobacteria bacterium]MCZ6592561.1 dTDP-4-dehydrorhamnose 3,5-epimerase [Alphaproteobacteria bacterium]